MKLKNILLVLTLGLIISSASKGQCLVTKENAKLFQEKIGIITNRDIYVVNEYVHFKLINLSSKQIKSWSKVVYVELISNDGRSFFQGKFPFDSMGCNSGFQVPENILTGNYYLKVYTKWMRNYSNKSYAYKPISILNPYNKAIYTSSEVDEDSDFYIDTLPYKSTRFFTLDSIYYALRNEKISPLIKTNNFAYNEHRGAYQSAITVADECTFFKNKLSVVNNSALVFKPDFVPETRGISLSGKLVDENTLLPIAYTTVNLTLFNGKTLSYSTITDSLGKFYFALPHMFDSKEVFISSANEKSPHKLFIDNDFCTAHLHLPFLPFDLDQETIKHFNRLVQKSQIDNYYNPMIRNNAEYTDNFSSNYYSKASYKIMLDDYIELPTIEDYFDELIPIAGFIKANGKKQLEVIGDMAELKLIKPLVLLDNLIITEFDHLLKIDPQKIKSIEVFNYPYVRGNISYGGIVNIKSKNNDLAGIDLPRNGLFFNFKFYCQDALFGEEKIENSTIPQLENDLYWYATPNFANDQETVEFSIGNNSENYELNIFTIDNLGNMFRDKAMIYIK